MENNNNEFNDDRGPAAPCITPDSPDGGDFYIEGLRKKIILCLKEIYDPEIPVNIYDLGMIYEIIISKDFDVHIKMTLTSPACPVAETLPPDVQKKVAEIEGVKSANVEVVWEPAWDKDMMTDEAKLTLNMF